MVGMDSIFLDKNPLYVVRGEVLRAATLGSRQKKHGSGLQRIESIWIAY